MENLLCPNINSCKLVNQKEFPIEENQRKKYINNYCKSEEKTWANCKRLIAKEKLNFCPDFVLPDTKLSVDEIIDKFDEDEILN